MKDVYQSDHEQRALMIHGIMAQGAGLPRDLMRAHAEQAVDAILEGQDVYNVAFAAGETSVSLSRRSLGVLLVIATRFSGMAANIRDNAEPTP